MAYQMQAKLNSKLELRILNEILKLGTGFFESIPSQCAARVKQSMRSVRIAAENCEYLSIF